MEIDRWEYEEVSVGEIKDLLLDDYEIEVDSPDGWVSVTDFVEKGNHKEHILEVESGESIRCSNKHLFETNKGWMFAEDIVNKSGIKVLHSDGSYKSALCKITENYIPIVDITVDHENHRYYTNNISSHNTGGGKSLAKCHMAASNLMYGKNVLYITMELAEEEVARRIDANIMDITLDEVKELPLKTFQARMSRYKSKTTGRLVIKEYPTGSAHVGHFRHLINELRMKKNFVPDVIFVDYLNICASSRVRGAAAANSYTLVKSIAEEVRGLAMEFNCAIVTSSQFNRDGYCLDLNTIVETDKGKTKISNIKIGDKVLSNTGFNTVTNVYEQKEKEVYVIKTKSGKSIICSEDHLFPTEEGEISIRTGLTVGKKIYKK